MKYKKTWIVLLVTAVFWVTACSRTDADPDLDNGTNPKLVSNEVFCYTTWKLTNEKVIRLEMLVDVLQNKILGFYVDGEEVGMPTLKAVAYFYGPAAASDALSFFDQCLEMGFECIRVDRWDESAQTSLTGKPGCHFTVIYGHVNEEGDCDWDALWNERNQ